MSNPSNQIYQIKVTLDDTHPPIWRRIQVPGNTTLLNLHDSWEWATREERKMLVRTMIQEVGCDVGTKCIMWVKVNPEYEILFRPMDRLRLDAGRRYWIREQGADVDIIDTGEELGQIATEFKIAFPVSHNTLTIVEE